MVSNQNALLINAETETRFDSYFSNEAKSFLKCHGWVRIDSIPASQEVIESILSSIGQLMEQYGQIKFWRVEALDTDKGTSLGGQMLRLHTELAEFQNPPEFVALYALQQANTGGELFLCDSRPFLLSLSEEEIKELLDEFMTVEAEEPIAERYGSYSYTSPILRPTPNGLQLRLDQKYIDKCKSLKIKNFRDKLMNYSTENTITLRQSRGSLVVWDNRFVLHGRSAFTDTSRLLWRICLRESNKL